MSQDPQEELIRWARSEAERLRGLSSNCSGEGSTVRAYAASALEFLSRHAKGTHFVSSAELLFTTERPGKVNARWALERTADILEAWAKFVEDGMAKLEPFEVQARIEAATDLMEQVQVLLDDPNVHAAAPVMLAGAALEEFLRSRIEAQGLTPKGKPGISSYAAALRGDGDISKQEEKDITAWAGQRNEAAHGEFAKLSRDRAQLMVDGINLFLQKRT